MITAFIFSTLLGASVSCSDTRNCSVSITITATIVPTSSLSVNETDLGIIGVDASRVAIHMQTTGVINAVDRTEEYLIMRRPGSTDATPVVARLDDLNGTVIIERNQEEMIAIRWDEAKPVLASLYSGRHMLAWRKARKAQNG